MGNQSIRSSARQSLVVLLALLAASCASTFSLREADPAKDAVVIGRVEGWTVGSEVLGNYATVSSPSMRCDGFFLLDREKAERLLISLSPSGFFSVKVPPGEYLLKRSLKTEYGKETGTARFGRLTAKKGGITNLGTIRVSGKLAKEEFSSGGGAPSLNYVTGFFRFTFSYPEEEPSWAQPISTFREGQEVGADLAAWKVEDANLVRGVSFPRADGASSGPSAWLDGPLMPFCSLGGWLLPHEAFEELVDALEDDQPEKVAVILRKRSLTAGSVICGSNFEGLTPFLAACLYGAPKTVTAMLKEGADPNSRCGMETDHTVYGKVNALAVLLMGLDSADPAVVARYRETADILLRAGARPGDGIFWKNLQTKREENFDSVDLAEDKVEHEPAFKPVLEKLLEYAPGHGPGGEEEKAPA